MKISLICSKYNCLLGSRYNTFIIYFIYNFERCKMLICRFVYVYHENRGIKIVEIYTREKNI